MNNINVHVCSVRRVAPCVDLRRPKSDALTLRIQSRLITHSPLYNVLYVLPRPPLTSLRLGKEADGRSRAYSAVTS